MSIRSLSYLTVIALACLNVGDAFAGKGGKDNTVTTVLSSANPTPANTPVVLTATVTAHGAMPVGTVIFRDGLVALSTNTLDAAGTAAFATTSLSEGTHSITVSYLGDVDFNPSISDPLIQTITAPGGPADQFITFEHPGTHNYGDAPFQLVASSSSGLPVTFTLVSGPATIDGDILTITGSGSIKVNASQEGNELFNPAETVRRSFSAIPAGLTVSGAVANDKVYDGTVDTTLDISGATLVGVAIGDDVSLDASAATAVFADKNVGTDKPVTISGLVLAGADAGKYTLTQPAAAASITPAALVPVITASDKYYDGTTTAVLSTGMVTGVVDGEDVVLSCGPADFCDPNPGSDKQVTATGLSLNGTDISNYTLASETAATTASIIPPRVAPSVAISLNPDGSAAVTCAGTPGLTYFVQATTSLSSPEWTTISTNVLDVTGNCVVTDVDAPQYTSRFYRTMASF